MSEGLQGVNLSLFDTPRQPSAGQIEDPKPEEFAYHIKQTKGGHDIMVCTVHPAPSSLVVEACAKGLPLFTAREVAELRDADQESINHLVDLKMIFQGSYVRHHLKAQIPA